MNGLAPRRLERREALITVGVAAVLTGLLVALGQWRYLPVYWCGSAALAAIWWFVVDLGARIKPVSWDLAAPPPRRAPQGGDARASRLSNRLTDLGAEHSDPAVVYELLVGLIDDRLHAHHGVGRGDEAADRVLGPMLRDFVQHQPPTRSLRSEKYLSQLVSGIEAI